MSFTGREGTTLGDQWGPVERLLRDVTDRDGSEMAIPARSGGRRSIAEIIAPGFEVDVGRQRCRTAASAGIEKTIINGTGLSVGFTFQTVKAEFVNQQEVQPSVSIERPGKRPVGQSRGEFLDQLGTGHITDAVAQDTCGPPYRLENPTFAQASLTHQDHILPAAHEVARGQLLDSPPIHTLGVELPVKTFQGGQFAELRIA